MGDHFASSTFLIIAIIFSFILTPCGFRGNNTEESEGCFIQEGLASWYGSDFQGTRTANGEIYDQETLTAAHKTLPFNTLVRVENMGNGETVTVRINNRGPYVEGRIIDLSRKAARKIGIIKAGLVRVKLYLVKMGDKSPEKLKCKE